MHRHAGAHDTAPALHKSYVGMSAVSMLRFYTIIFARAYELNLFRFLPSSCNIWVSVIISRLSEFVELNRTISLGSKSGTEIVGTQVCYQGHNVSIAIPL